MQILNHKIGVIEVLLLIMLIWLGWGAFQERQGLQNDSATVDGYIKGFGFSGNTFLGSEIKTIYFRLF